MDNTFSFGANPSPKDPRTVQHNTLTQVTAPLFQGGIEYLATDIENQHKVGVCTSASLIQNREKANNMNKKRYSIEFQYLLQKKMYDLNWAEGSSILSALKVGKKYGFLPAELFVDLNGNPYATEADRNLSYADYIAKLQKIPDAEVQRLISLCVDKIAGYSQIDISDPQNLARAIVDTSGGVLCRYEVGNEWWVPSWLEKDISPLRPPKVVISGHAVGETKFDFNMYNLFTIPNTWGPLWCRNGNADIIWNNYKPTEAWAIMKYPVIERFDTNLSFGQSGDMVVNLQNALKIKGFFNYSSTGYFGVISWFAVKAFQKAYALPTTGYFGPLSRACMNNLFGL